jgi:hypothetical protein
MTYYKLISTRIIYIYLLSCFLTLSLYSNAQLSGTYTIGGSSPDYPTLYAAVNSLTISGVSGPVIFNIRNGTYNEYTIINSIAGVTSQNTVTFQSESGDSSLVTVTSSYGPGTIVINNCDNLIIKKVSIINTSTNQSKAIGISDSRNISIENCYLSCPNDYNNSGTVYMLEYTNPSNKTTIKNSYIFALQYGILADGHYDSLTIENNVINASFKLYMDAKFIGNRFKTKTICNYGYFPCSFIANIFEKGCSFVFWKHLAFSSNIFYGVSDFSYCDSSIFKNNCFDSLGIHHSPHSLLAGNKTNFYSEIMNCSHTDFIGNRILDNFQFIYSDTCTLINNCIHKEFIMWYSDRCKVLFNNFSKKSALIFSTTCQVPPEVKYNNFYNEIPFGYPYQDNKIDYNNYYPAINTSEMHSYHYDPMYDDTIHLQALNPLLAGRAYSSMVVSHDIDSVARNYPYTIGANEICISDLQPDTFFLACDDSIQLQLCYHNDSAIYIWTPTYNLSDPNIFNPIASPDVDTTYHVSVYLNSMLIANDSFRISMSQLPVALATYQIYQATVQFINKSTCATSYYWDFGDGVSSTLLAPSHQYAVNGTYTVSLIAYNAVGSDTITFPIPIYYFIGIHENESDFNCSIFPNPTDREFSITVPPSSTQIQILNSYGQAVQRKIVDNETEFKFSIETSGIYYIQITTNKQLVTKKIIVAN